MWVSGMFFTVCFKSVWSHSRCSGTMCSRGFLHGFIGHEEAPTDEAPALCLAVGSQARLQLRFVVHIVVNDVLRHFLLGQNLHDNVLLNKVWPKCVHTECARMVTACLRIVWTPYRQKWTGHVLAKDERPDRACWIDPSCQWYTPLLQAQQYCIVDFDAQSSGEHLVLARARGLRWAPLLLHRNCLLSFHRLWRERQHVEIPPKGW